jgi:hypothetical protein
MAAVRELRRLFEAIATKDWASAQVVAEKLAATEAIRGNRGAARTLHDALNPHEVAKLKTVSLLELGLSELRSPTRLADVRLASTTRRDLTSIVDEFKYSTALESRGFRPRNRLILTGALPDVVRL